MCGIAGYKTNKIIQESVLVDMVESLYHRGPDSAGFFRSVPYSAGMRRLSINDVKGGDQPLYNETGNIVLIYNGEIYNYHELRNKLESRGHHFNTHSDGEVICHLYEEYETELFRHLDGMFAIALWDVSRERLVLARDIPGEKPLYYSMLSDRDIVFASELKSIVKFPGLNASLNHQALWDFPTFLWIPEPDTVYKGIRALPRGHVLVSDKSGTRIKAYPNDFTIDRELNTDDDMIQATRKVIADSVYSRLLSDVPVGSFLSGGLDSSIVAALAVKKLTRLTTFTIGFDDILDPYHGRADESLYAKSFAEKIGSEHHTVHVKAEDFRRELGTFCKYGDQPFSVSSGLGILFVARAAHERGIKVLLSGDGADESFGGYTWYFQLKNAINANAATFNDSDNVSFQHTGLKEEEVVRRMNAYSPQKRAWAWHYYASEYDKTLLFNKDIQDGVKSSIRFFHDFKKDADWSSEDFIKQDREFYFPFEMLRKVDRMTMAYSVEGRVPFAAPAVLSLADRLPYTALVRNGYLKWVLREAFVDVLTEEVYRRPKHGFNVPIDHWLKNDWSDLFEESFSADSALMKHGIINSKSRDHAHAMVHDHSRLNGHTIFSFIMLNMWLEEFCG